MTSKSIHLWAARSCWTSTTKGSFGRSPRQLSRVSPMTPDFWPHTCGNMWRYPDICGGLWGKIPLNGWFGGPFMETLISWICWLNIYNHSNHSSPIMMAWWFHVVSIVLKCHQARKLIPLDWYWRRREVKGHMFFSHPKDKTHWIHDQRQQWFAVVKFAKIDCVKHIIPYPMISGRLDQECPAKRTISRGMPLHVAPTCTYTQSDWDAHTQSDWVLYIYIIHYYIVYIYIHINIIYIYYGQIHVRRSPVCLVDMPIFVGRNP